MKNHLSSPISFLQKFMPTLLLLIVATLLAACGGAANADADSGQLKVVATTGQIHDALKNIGGDAIDLTGLLGPGVDPHLYVPTESNVATFSNADAIFYNGLHLEAQMTRIMEQMADRGKIVVAVGEALPEDQLLDLAGFTFDPHVWNDSNLWSMAVEVMRDTLVEADPDNAELYKTNTDAYLTEIAATHQYVEEQIARIPEDKRIMITAHDAFGYFARAYGLTVRGLQGISTESEASTADVQELAQYIVDNQVPALFVETSVSPKTIESVQQAVQSQGFDVVIGGSLFSDALGEEGHEAETYNGMLRHNARTLADALSGE